MAKWKVPPPAPTFEEFKDRVLKAYPDCKYEEREVAGRKGGRFVRKLPGKERTTRPFFPDELGQTLSPGTAADFCDALDVDWDKVSLDDSP